MTDIRLRFTETDLLLEADEHAGDKIICAVASDNVCNLINILRHDKYKLITFEWNADSGHTRVYAEVKPEYKERFIAIEDMIRIAFDALAERYPDYIKVSHR